MNPQVPHHQPSWRIIRHDIKLSVISAGVFALAASGVLTSYGQGLTRLYSDPQQYGLWYLGVSYGLVLEIGRASCRERV